MKPKQLLLIILVLAFAFTLAACKNTAKKGTFELAPVKVDDNGNPVDINENTDTGNKASIEYTTVTGTFTFADLGQVQFEVYPEFAPQSAFNFLYLAQNGCYNGTIVDRVQKGYTIELGEYLQDFVEIKMPDGEEYTIKGEFANNGVENPLSVAEGMLVFCRDYEDADSAKTKFMICLDTAACQGLQDEYAPFGKITEGMEIIRKIGSRKVDKFNRPINAVILLAVDIDGDIVYPAPDKIRK